MGDYEVGRGKPPKHSRFKPGNNANPNANSNASPSQFSVLLSALRAPTPKNLALLPDAGPVVPTIVYTGPTRSAAQVDALAALPEAADPAQGPEA